MPQLAARPAVAPAKGAIAHVGSPAAKGRPDEKAEADFGKHIDGMATGDERGLKTALATVGELQRPSTRWHPLKDGEPLVLLPDKEPVTDLEILEAASSAVVETPSDGPEALPSPAPTSTLFVGDLAAAAASVAAGPAEARPVGADAGAKPHASTVPPASVAPVAPSGHPKAPIAAEGLPQSAPRVDARETPRAPNEAPRRVHDVVVVARETHLPPAAPSPVLRARLPGGRDVAQPRTGSAAEPKAGAGKGVVVDVGADPKPLARPTAKSTAGDEGQNTADTGQRPANPTLPRVQAQPAGEAPFQVAQPARAVRSPGQDDHPAPQVTVPLPHQIADAVIADLPPICDTSAVTPGSSSAVSSAPQPVKVLTIQLSPAELGTLTVRISLKNDALELQVETSRRETARLVDADRETLSTLLRSAGYHVEAMTVRAVEPPGAAVAAGASPGSPDGAPQSQSGGSQADQRSSGGRAPAGQDREGHGTRQDIRGDEDSLRPRAGRGLYV